MALAFLETWPDKPFLENTYEHDLHIWLKRTWSLQAAYGDEAYALAQAGKRLLSP